MKLPSLNTLKVNVDRCIDGFRRFTALQV